MKISLFLDFLKYICILSCMRGQNDKVILKFTKFLRYFQKKKNSKIFGGAQARSSSGSATVSS